jgi:hypothetical protein
MKECPGVDQNLKVTSEDFVRRKKTDWQVLERGGLELDLYSRTSITPDVLAYTCLVVINKRGFYMVASIEGEYISIREKLICLIKRLQAIQAKFLHSINHVLIDKELIVKANG